MKNKYKLMLGIVGILIVISLLVVFLFIKPTNNEEKTIIKVLDTIDNYDYSLKENDSKLKKDLFNELKKVLESDEINYEEYSKLVSKIFIVDVFSLNNKLNKYDVGGLDYIYPKEKDKFKNIMIDTLYDSLENNVNEKRKQDLPEVSKIEVLEINESEFLFDKNKFVAYDIVLEWEYSKDLGYDTNASVKVIKEKDNVYVVEYKAE